MNTQRDKVSLRYVRHAELVTDLLFTIDTVLAYKQRNKVGRFAEKDATQVERPEQPVNILVGSRCEVESLEAGLNKRGTVRFVGQTQFSTGTWVGVEYDEPFGKNDGSCVISNLLIQDPLSDLSFSVKGERYFSCRQNYGVFVRPEKVKVGDYPVEELELEDEEM